MGIPKSMVFVNCFLFLSACKTSTPRASNKEILGEKDNRTTETDGFLLSVIGQIAGERAQCTGFFSARGELVTAAHCLKDETGDLTSLSFTTGSGQTYQLRAAKSVDTKKDLVFFSVEPVAKNFLSFSAVRADVPLNVTGYDPTAQTILSHTGCAFDQEIGSAGVFTHSCDTAAGMSGSPVLQEGKVVGIHLGYQQAVNRNVAYDVTRSMDSSTDVANIGIVNEGFKIKLPKIPKPKLPPLTIDVPVHVGRCQRTITVSVGLAASCAGGIVAIDGGCVGPQMPAFCTAAIKAAEATCAVAAGYLFKLLEDC